jgi:triosephosphate isomerase
MASDIRPLVAGNWKMNGFRSSLDELRSIADGFAGGLEAVTDALICPPATLLSLAAQMLAGTRVWAGAQDCHVRQSGAHTGDLSAEMLKDAGASHVIVGHSERRTDHAETDALVHDKAAAAWRAGLVAIICIGESRSERERGDTLDVLSRQVQGSVPAGARPENTIIAYEPVWAIGTGLTPTLQDVAEAHAHIREKLTDRFGPGAARIRLLYGGSVKPGNAAELLGVGNVNGALVGGASLKASEFLAIAQAYSRAS